MGQLRGGQPVHPHNQQNMSGIPEAVVVQDWWTAWLMGQGGTAPRLVHSREALEKTPRGPWWQSAAPVGVPHPLPVSSDAASHSALTRLSFLMSGLVFRPSLGFLSDHECHPAPACPLPCLCSCLSADLCVFSNCQTVQVRQCIDICVVVLLLCLGAVQRTCTTQCLQAADVPVLQWPCYCLNM